MGTIWYVVAGSVDLAAITLPLLLLLSLPHYSKKAHLALHSEGNDKRACWGCVCTGRPARSGGVAPAGSAGVVERSVAAVTQQCTSEGFSGVLGGCESANHLWAHPVPRLQEEET